MRDDSRNAEQKLDPLEAGPGEHQTLKFFFTPQTPPAPASEDEVAAMAHPNARQTTFRPDTVAALEERFGEAVEKVVLYAGEHSVLVARERIADVLRFLKEEHGFDYLADLGGTDRFTEADRFEVAYNLVAIAGRKRIRVKTRTDEGTPVPTATDVYPAATWNERECYDMLGVEFAGHPDLRRMFMPEDFDFHPLRKEFPTLGIPGSLPLPNQTTDGAAQPDPFARAHGDVPTD